MIGNVCPEHFRATGHNGKLKSEMTFAELRAVADNCDGCREANRVAMERIQREHTIDPNQGYGVHIALFCADHPELRWTTKNIDGIGCRSIFFNPTSGTECDCSIGLLRVVGLD